eukprot:1757176-Prymnesium_polylepis.1
MRPPRDYWLVEARARRARAESVFPARPCLQATCGSATASRRRRPTRSRWRSSRTGSWGRRSIAS